MQVLVSLYTFDMIITLDHTLFDAELSFDPRSKELIPVDIVDAVGYVKVEINDFSTSAHKRGTQLMRWMP